MSLDLLFSEVLSHSVIIIFFLVLFEYNLKKYTNFTAKLSFQTPLRFLCLKVETRVPPLSGSAASVCGDEADCKSQPCNVPKFINDE